MTLLFLGLLALLIWAVRLQNRVNALESGESERLLSLERRVRELDERWKAAGAAKGTAAHDRPARSDAAPTPATPGQPGAAIPSASPSQPVLPQRVEPASPAPRPAPPAPAPARPALAPPPPAPPRPVVSVPAAASTAPATPPRPPSVPRRTQPTPPPPQAPVPFDWEALVGVKLFSWIAGIALALGAIFFLRYSIQTGWLQPPVRMAMGLLAGVGLLVGCEMKAARRYAVTANALDASGLVILFSTVFASHALWQLVGPFTAFALLAVVTVVAVLLSIRRDSVFIALLGLVGGFATPALLSSGQDNPLGLFGYLLLLNAGLAWVAYYRRWVVLVALSLVFTTLYQWGWVFTFLTPEKLPLAVAIFLVFPALAWAVLARKDTAAGGERFRQLAALNASLPLLFTLHLAATPAYGERFQLLFGFLFLVDAGLFAIAWARGPRELHALGAVSTLLVFVSWWGTQYPGMRPDAWRAVLAFVALFVGFYLLTGRAGRRRTQPFEGLAARAVLAAPLLLFMFPALASTEPGFAAPIIPFAVLFVLMGALAAYAITEGDGLVFVLGSFLALACEAVWSSRYLTPGRLLEALAIYGAFGLFYLGVPLLARRAGKALRPEGLGAFVLLVALGLLFFLSTGPMAGASLWGLALLLLILNGAIILEGSAATHPVLAIAGTLVSWLVLATWWASGALAGQAVPAMIVVSGFAVASLAGHLWLGRSSRDGGDEWTQAGASLALVGHLFLLFVASQPSLSIPPWPLFGVLAVLDLAIGVAALYARRGQQHVAALVASQLVVITWVAVAPDPPWPLVAMSAAAVVAAVGLAWSALARRTAQPHREHFDGAAAAALLLGQVLLVIAGSAAGEPGVVVLTIFHVVFLVAALALATWSGWPVISVLALVPTALAAMFWQESHAGAGNWHEALVLATPLYLVFLAYPLVLARRVGTRREPHMAAVLASAVFFLVARLSLIAGGYEAVLGALPLGQAALMAILLAGLLRVEPPGARTLGRLALVAGTVLAFITVAIPLQLDKAWLTIGWALEGAALAWLYTRIPHRGLFWSAFGLLAVVFVRLALNPEVLLYQERGTVAIWNWYLYTYLTASASMLLASSWLSRTKDGLPAGLPRGGTLLSAAATTLLFLLLNIEIADFYATGPRITFHFSAGLAQDLTYTLGWALFAVALLVVGIVIRSHPARLAAILLLTATVMKGFLHDVARLGGLYRVMSFVGLAICLALVAVVLQRFVLSLRPNGARP